MGTIKEDIKYECPKFTAGEKKELVRIQEEIDAEKRGDESHAKVGVVVASRLSLDVEKPGARRVSF